MPGHLAGQFSFNSGPAMASGDSATITVSACHAGITVNLIRETGELTLTLRAAPAQQSRLAAVISPAVRRRQLAARVG